MTKFQKIQLISSFVPFYSFLFILVVTYFHCWKVHKYYFALVLTVSFAFLPVSS